MAVAPLFVADMVTLKAALKLQGVATPGGLAQIDEAVRNARAQFLLRLGFGTIATISATPFTETPATNADARRFVANLCEVLLVRKLLLPVFAVAFLDGTATTQETWNQEAAWRNSNQRQVTDEIERLNTEIEKYLDLLKGEVGPGDEVAIRFDAIVPDNVPDRPGATVFPSLRNPANWPKQEWPF